VSLEEAVERIKPFMNNLDRQVWLAKQGSLNPKNGLKVDESAAIRLYTMQWSKSHESLYVKLNQTLRDEVRENLKPWFLYLKLLLTALYKLPSRRGTIWRIIQGQVDEDYVKNKIWWGFSLCTETRDIAINFLADQPGPRTLFQINCVKGRSIESHSQFQAENEIVLMPGTYLHVSKKWRAPDGIHMIDLQEADPPYQLLAPPFNLKPFGRIFFNSQRIEHYQYRFSRLIRLYMSHGGDRKY
jgi:hypothetical protein